MDKNDNRLPGTYKAAKLTAHIVTEAELDQINKYAMTPLAAEDVFVFKSVLCDTEVDRSYEHFSKNALTQLSALFLGRTVIKDHYPTADNQVARIYATELVDTGDKTSSGEPYLQLQAKCYMVKTASNADLITEIKAGIKKEGSVGFRLGSAICSICGSDNMESYCRHFPGRQYSKDGLKTLCVYKLDSVKDAYEFSLVAVPTQRAAGVCKSYTGVTVYEKDEAMDTQADRERFLNLRARIVAATIKTKEKE